MLSGLLIREQIYFLSTVAFSTLAIWTKNKESSFTGFRIFAVKLLRMLFIYRPGINLVLRNLLRPFAKAIPEKFHFPVNGTFSLTLPENKSIKIVVNPTSYIGRKLFWGGVEGFEYNSVKVFIELAKTSKLFLDIGANFGYYSLLAAAYNRNLQIIGFEPVPAAFKFFRKNIDINSFSNIKVETIALSDKAGQTTFFASKSRKFMDFEDHLNSDGTINESNIVPARMEKFDVITETLDKYAEKNLKTKVDLIKIDTEASEHLIFSAGTSVLKEHRPIIICEVLHNKIEDKLENIFKGLNYVYYKVGSAGLEKKSNLVSEDKRNWDFFFVPAEREAELTRLIK